MTLEQAADAAPPPGAASSPEKLIEQMGHLWDLEVARVRGEVKEGAETQARLQALAGGPDAATPTVGPKALLGKTVFVAGANGRTGARIVKLLLRMGCTVRAGVRGTEKVEDFARLSYEIGAEEGEYEIVAPWVRKSIEITGTAAMIPYNIGKLVVTECDLLDPNNVARAVKGCDAIIYCASSFDGGRIKLRAPQVFSPEALFAVTDRIFLESVREGDREREAARGTPVEGVVDREGVALAASALLKDQRLQAMGGSSMPRDAKGTKLTPFVLVSAKRDALPKRGGFAGVLPAFEGYDVEEMKTEGAKLLKEAGLTGSVTLEMSRYDENFAGEGRRPVFSPGGSTWVKGEKQKVISRLDAALAAVLALIADQAGGAHFDLETHTKDRDWRDL